MKKGFTLIEMLGIISVLAIILYVTFPNLSKSLKDIKSNNDKSFYNAVRIGAEAYVGIKRDNFPELDTPGGSVQISIQELYDYNLLKEKDDSFSLTSKVTVQAQNDGTLKYSFNGVEI